MLVKVVRLVMTAGVVVASFGRAGEIDVRHGACRNGRGLRTAS